MKRNSLTLILVLFLTVGTLIFTSCSDDDDGGSEGLPMGGQEAALQGAYWDLYNEDGVYFDGTGGGYDLDGYSLDSIYFDCSDLIIYRFNGTTLTICEDGECVSGTLIVSQSGTITFTNEEGSITVIPVTVENTCD